MRIRGFQKVTLIDYPGKIACTIFLYGCNFKCGFCHNPELVVEANELPDLKEEEILDYLVKRKNLLEGVCISGGEPLLRIDTDFLKKLKDLGYLIKIDTNGTCPDVLQKLINEKLVDYVAMDIKSSKDNYKKVVNSDVNLEMIERSIEIISGLENYEFRTTIVSGIHDLKEVIDIAIWLRKVGGRKLKRFALQGFKNSGKFVDMNFSEVRDTSEEVLKEMKNAIEDYFEEVVVRV